MITAISVILWLTNMAIAAWSELKKIIPGFGFDLRVLVYVGSTEVSILSDSRWRKDAELKNWGHILYAGSCKMGRPGRWLYRYGDECFPLEYTH